MPGAVENARLLHVDRGEQQPVDAERALRGRVDRVEAFHPAPGDVRLRRIERSAARPGACCAARRAARRSLRGVPRARDRGGVRGRARAGPERGGRGDQHRRGRRRPRSCDRRHRASTATSTASPTAPIEQASSHAPRSERRGRRGGVAAPWASATHRLIGAPRRSIAASSGVSTPDAHGHTRLPDRALVAAICARGLAVRARAHAASLAPQPRRRRRGRCGAA